MMKHRILIAALLLFFSAPAAANIASSKHNLSAGGTGTIKATSETELCIFCHIPHNARPAAPLWNHTDTAVAGAGYTMYNSDYLTRAGYSTPIDVGQRSRLCLSCHDGTVAVGSVYMVRGVAQTSPLGMSGVDAAGKMPSTAAGYLGTDLRNDHPVSIKYDTGSFTTIGLRGMELKTPAPSINPKPYQGVKLYGSVSGSIQGYVECTSCHDPHNDANAKFLVVSTTNGALCMECHSKTGWTGSVHQQASAVTVNNPAGETQPIPAGTIAQAACMACHKNHSGGGTPYLLRKSEENTCFNGASTSCHGSSATTTEKPTQNRIQSVLSKARAHPTATNTLLEKHRNLDVLTPAQLGANNRHAECPDCHNPHQATKLPQRVAATSWYPSSITINSNRVSNSGALTGVPGVSPPPATANWYVRAAAAYTVKEKAEFEYEICYKCHSSYSLGEAGPVIIGLTGPSGVTITDQSWEFSPANRSGHPVEAALGISRSLTANQLNTH
jgi:predicted CXXCH cytochrome family protein